MDWDLILKIAIPVGTLFLGAIINRFAEQRAKLLTYFAHTAAVTVRPPQGAQAPTSTVTVADRGGPREAMRQNLNEY